MTKVIGLSGGIGSGKSTVSARFAELGAVVIDADAIVHELQAPGMPMLRELAEAFGEDLLDENGALDRKALGEIVFRDDDARARLNAIVHPQVGLEFRRRLEQAIGDAVPLIVLDIPLLFEGRESGRGQAAQLPMDATVVVWVPEALQVERQMKRDGCSRQQAMDRIRAQLSLDHKRELADHVIDNSGSQGETERQVQALHAKLSRSEPEAAP